MNGRSGPLRTVAAIAIGALTWFAVINGAMWLLQSAWPAYAVAHPERAYSLPMLFVRLVIFAAATAGAAAVASAISQRPWMPWLAGAILFAASIPDHLYPGFVWDEFPVWYHLVYLAYIVPVSWCAGRLALTRAPAR